MAILLDAKGTSITVAIKEKASNNSKVHDQPQEAFYDIDASVIQEPTLPDMLPEDYNSEKYGNHIR